MDRNRIGEPGREESNLAAELSAIAHEPLLPIEKKLIAGSLILGVLLLGLLLWVSATFFPVGAFHLRDQVALPAPAAAAPVKAPGPG